MQMQIDHCIDAVTSKPELSRKSNITFSIPIKLIASGYMLIVIKYQTVNLISVQGFTGLLRSSSAFLIYYTRLWLFKTFQ